MNITKLRKVFTKANERQLIDFDASWTRYSDMFGLSSKKDEDMFLAQVLQEVGSNLISRRENLNYTPSALRGTFKRYRLNPNWSERDGRGNGHPAKQENIGNVAYADRIGNGDIASGDGFRFRGGGYFQLTGRANWDEIAVVVSLATGTAITPDFLEENIDTTEYGLLTAMGFWFARKCYNCKDIDCVTGLVNRHTSSYDERKKNYIYIASL